MERELAQAQKLKAIGQLAAGIAHEINTPTQYIGDNARFLQNAFTDIGGLLDAYDRLLRAVEDGTVTDALVDEVEAKQRDADLDYLTAEIPQAIQQSLEGVQHVAGIVGAIKEYAHPASARKQAVDLNHAVAGGIAICRNEWKEVAELASDFAADLPPVTCLPSDIHRIVVNLVVNAAHAVAAAAEKDAGRPHEIVVRTRRDGPWAEIRVEDSGTGIPEDLRERIFEPFFTTKDVGQGSGQGLALTRAAVVDRHGGTIDFQSAVGRGTTFIIRLPIEAAETVKA
jgi:signal transduction histidine kinase